jgi:hypothetical protein
MAGVWVSNMSSLVTFRLQSTWPAKLFVDFSVLIDADAANCHRTATFAANVNSFHEIKIEFSCVSPSDSSFVSLQ